MVSSPRALWALALTVALGFGAVSEASGQNIARIELSQIQAVMPAAARFSEPAGDPPVISGYAVGGDGAETLVGYVFLTSDYPPEQIGYNGPIEALVGMRLDGTITGVRVTYYEESYMRQMGDFLRTRGFQQQYSGKYIGDPFRVWGDVDGISRVTISVRALSRGIRDSARRVASTYLGAATRPAAGEDGPPDIVGKSWFELNRMGALSRLELDEPGEGSAAISIAYIGSDAAGEYLLGRRLYERATRTMRVRGEIAQLMMYAVEGPRLRLFVPEGWSIEQGGDTTAIDPADILSLGLLPTEGVVADEASMVGVMMIERDLDLREPFRFIYDLGRLGVHTLEYATLDARLRTQDAVTLATPNATRIAEAAADVTGEVAREISPADSSPAEPTVSESTLADSTPTIAPTAIAPTPSPQPPSAPTTGDVLPTDSALAEATTGAVVSGSAAPGGAEVSSQNFDFAVSEDETLLGRTLADTSWSRVAKMLFVLGLATWAFFAKSTLIRWVSVGATLTILGFLDGSFLSVSHITSGIWAGAGVYVRDLPLLLIVVYTVVTTLIWGRVFCGFLCPFGALQDVIERVVPKRFQRALPQRVHDRALYLKYGILALIVLPALAGSHASFYQYFEPFGTVFFLSSSVFFWTIAGALLAASAVIPRFYCRYACPLGAALGVASLISIKRIRRVEQCNYCKVCEQACPTGAIRGPAIDFKECVRCNECEILLAEKRGVCQHDMDTFLPRLVQLRIDGAEVSGGA